MTKSELEPLLRSAENDAERRLLASAKYDASRPGARAAMLAALGVPPVPARVRWSERILRGSGVSAVHGVVLALLVTAGAGTAFMFSAPSKDASATDARDPRASADTNREASSRPVDHETHDRSADTVAVTADSLPNAPAPNVPAPDAPRPKASSASAASSRTATDALDREIARVAAARAALGKNDAEETLRLLDEYDREFPRGAFAVEVSVLRIEALLRTGRTEEARRLGSKFLSEHREGAFARRVSASLAATPGGVPPANAAPSRSSDE